MDPTKLPPNSYEDRRWVPIFAVSLCLGFATCMVALRIWTRKVVLNQMGLDDYFAVFTLLLIWGDGIAIGFCVKYGLGRHAWMLNPLEIPLYFRSFYVTIVLYTAALLFVKLTFLFQYYRVLAVQKMRKVYLSAIVIVTAWGISQLLIGILLCRPIQGFWDKTIEASCIPNYPQFYINAAGNIITDVAVFAIPLPVIGHLNLPRTQKLLLLGIFSLGFFTVAISLIRIKFLKIAEDFSWENVDASSWSIGELSSAITCACLPTLRPLLAHYFPALATQASRASSAGHKSGRSGRSASKDIESAASSNRMDTLMSSESRDPINDERLAACHDLQHQDSGDASEGVMGLQSTREGLGLQHRQPKAGVETRRIIGRSMSDEHIIGLHPTTRTEIGPTRRSSERIASHNSIRVQRDVYQTKTPQG